MTLKKMLLPLVALGMLALFASCDKNPDPKEMTTISLNKKTATVQVGKSITLKATLNPAEATDKVAWESADVAIATVSDKGTVKGIKEGKTTITAKLANGNSATCEVTVKKKGQNPTPEKTEISLDKSTASIAAGETLKLTATLTPDTATDAISWESSDATIATVNKGSVKGVKEGKATITAKLENGNSASCEVTVTKKGDKPTPPAKGDPIELKENPITFALGDVLSLKDYIKFNPEVAQGENVTIAEVLPEDDPLYHTMLVINQRDMTITANHTGECKIKISRTNYADKSVIVNIIVKAKEFKLPDGAKILITGGDKVEGVTSVAFNPFAKFKLTHKLVDKEGKDIPNVIVTRTFDEKLLQPDLTEEGLFGAVYNEDGEAEDFTTEIKYTVNGTKLSATVKVECKNKMGFNTVEYK